MLLIAFGTGVYGQRSGSNGNIVYGTIFYNSR